MLLNYKRFLCWYQVWSLVMMSSGINGGNCPLECNNNCKYDPVGNLISATCKDIKIPSLPKTLQELHVSDASTMTALMFRQFRPFVLSGMQKLEILQIQSYQISTLNGECFQGSPSLKTLDLSKNMIGQISEINFKGLQLLTYLNLNQNRLTKLGDFVFRQLTALENLNIALNRLEEIGENDFKGLTSIKSIDLQSNQIRAIHRSAFSGLNTLETIKLQINKITTIDNGLFNDLPNFMTLNFQKNKVSHIDPGSMVNTPITYVNLMENEFTKVPTEFLQKVSNEKLEVNLARNNITRIDAGDLQRITLKTLFLVSNSLASIHPDALCDSFIGKLDLEQNKLQHLPEGLKNSLNQSNSLLLSNNPWSCDCDIQWMQSLLKKNIPEPVCAQPLSYHGQKLSQILHDLEISCGDFGTLPVPSMHFPVPPRLNPVTPHLETKTTSCQTTTTTTTTQAQLNSSQAKGDNLIIAVIAGVVCGVIILAGVTIFIVKHMVTKKVKVEPEFSIKCRKPDINFRPVLKYAPQSNQYVV